MTKHTIKSAVTIALVSEIKTGPWIYWDDLEKSMSKAAALGFDAIELFTPSGSDIDNNHLTKLLKTYSLELAAVGTGAGKVIHGLTLTDPNPAIREQAISFIKEMILFGAQHEAPAIIGSMQGNVVNGMEREQSIAWLAEGLGILEKIASEQGVFLIYEPLNRYETNMFNTLGAGVEFVEQHKLTNVKLLADLFHMNIEEVDSAKSILTNRNHIGHVHFADSNRRPIGNGQTNMSDIASALKEIKYAGYVSAEAFPWPTPDDAARQTINSFNRFFN
jgi:sugar phosphate isomerase/epimerase